MHPTEGPPGTEHPVFRFGSELADAIAAESPILATLAGVKGFDDRWDDLGPSGLRTRRARFEELSGALRALEAAHASGAPRHVWLALRVMREYLDERSEFFASDDPYYDLNHIASSFQLLPMVFDFVDAQSPASLEDAAKRLETLGEATQTYRALLAAGRDRGCVVARRQVEAAIRQGTAQAVGGNHYAHLVKGWADAGRVEPPLRARLERGAERAREAVTELTGWLADAYLPHAAQKEGVGRERYARSARRQLGTALDLDEAYAWGLAEVARLEAEIGKLARSIGARFGMADASVSEIVSRLETEEASTAALPEPFLDAMRARQTRALALIDPHFEVPPMARRLDVKLAPAGGPIGAYYVPPSEDFSRPGSVWYRPGSRARMPLWQEITTAFHEGFPGHHLQISLALANRERLTRFQRLFGDWTGYAEGWALYAEQLMLELGGFETPEEILGMHVAQLTRACRVVVDIGLHLDLPIPASASFHPGERWSYALAVEMMRDCALLTQERAESEVTRYLGWPAQAITYKLGQRAMLSFRQERREKEGAAFDPKRFHADVLSTGMVGLDTLRAALAT